jgi:hypothetical protein
MSTVNKAVATTRALFDDLDTDVLKQVADGEQNVLDAFSGAIEEHDDGRTREELVEMRQTLEALISEARQMARG